MAHSLQGKTVVVTGATSGIGRATVLEFATHGANVVASGRRETLGAELVLETRELPGEVVFVRADVTVANDVENLIEATVGTFGRLDYAFNNAGGTMPRKLLHEYTDEDWDFYSDTFLKSVWRCMKHEIEHMLPNGAGVIINNSSTVGVIGSRNAAYSAMKHGVIGLTKAATRQYEGVGIRFNAVLPGLIETEMTGAWQNDPERMEAALKQQSVKRIGEAREVAALVRWMCSDEAAFVTGVAWPIDGGSLAGDD